MRSSTVPASTSPQPGSMLSAQNEWKFMFIGTRIGMVSATTRAPRSAAVSLALIWCQVRSGSALSTERTFQLTGRPPRRLISVRKATSPSENRSRQPWRTTSSVVPSFAATTSQRASISSSDAQRDATGLPLPSWWPPRPVENPRAPAPIMASRIPAISVLCSEVASDPTASSPMT